MPIYSPLRLLGEDPVAFFLLVASLIGALVLHEFAHAATAVWLGDRLPKATGRVSLNPARHLDPFGILMLMFVGFGWARPVEFRLQALRWRRAGGAVVALAGPGMNLLLALAGAIGLSVVYGNGFETLENFFEVFFVLNVLLAVFNLIPLPPLDGSRILTIFLPPRKQNVIYFLDRWGIFILLGLLFFGGLQAISPITNAIEDLFLTIAPGNLQFVR